MIDIVRNSELIEKIASDHKFDVVMVERVLWMSIVLEAISKSERLNQDFALMGGSAIVFLYGNIYRLSVDLDMDYINNPNLGKKDIEEIGQIQNEHKEEIQKIANKLQLKYESITQEDERFLQIKLNYPSKYLEQGSVELDLGYRYCHTVLKVENKSWPNIFGIEDWIGFDIKTYQQEELWASKINAMVSTKRIDVKKEVYLGFKNKIRHLYDVWILVKDILPHRELDLELLKKLCILFGITRIEEYEFCRGETLKGYLQKNYDNDLYPVLKTTQVTPKLIQMQREVRIFLDKYIFSYNEQEREFMEDFYSENFRPNKLFNVEISNRLNEMYFYDEMLKMIKR